ncbi:MAG: glucose 1-dehydrogenase [Planctomycetota bacterium]|nr:glucose 1-dehydrogenase [Planctomycetota bacterium]MDA1139199.1 glucose 1-dehydrogenase [Planctomycetota bacterium]
MKLEGKVALVTGGGTGIGRACSLALAAEGAAVVVNYSRSVDEAEATAEEARQLSGEAVALKANVASDEEVKSLIRTIDEKYGRLDVLVNNAGTTTFVPHHELDSLTEDMWDAVMAVNVKGTFFASRAAVKLMRKNSEGAIVNIASVAGHIGNGSSIAYCASKAALHSLTKSLARVLAPEIRVNSVSPGVTDTRWIADFGEFIEKNIRATPMERAAQPEDIAKAVMFFVVDSPFITGQDLIADGGRLLGK